MLSKRNMQDILEATIMAIVSQGGPSASYSGACRYRGLHGRKCAIGHWIDDEHYVESMEDAMIDDRFALRALNQSLGMKIHPGNNDFDFFYMLQATHDEAVQISGELGGGSFFQVWAGQLKDFCWKFDLRFPEELI